jgi:hypothetical protein
MGKRTQRILLILAVLVGGIAAIFTERSDFKAVTGTIFWIGIVIFIIVYATLYILDLPKRKSSKPNKPLQKQEPQWWVNAFYSWWIHSIIVILAALLIQMFQLPFFFLLIVYALWILAVAFFSRL